MVGCSTGQEVYSLAISWLEFAGDRSLPFRIFGTDLDEVALEKARAGFFPNALLQDVSHERLRRFFVEADGGFRIQKALRETCVFAHHNVVTDPPFSRLDLISCRNLLIYLEPALQKKVLPLFHYALRPAGFLLLGASESIGGVSHLFAVHDGRHKLYGRKPAAVHASFPLGVRQADRPPPPVEPLFKASGSKLDPVREADRLLLARFTPPGVLINADLDILQFGGETDRYLQPAPGKPTHHLLKMVRSGLVLPLRQVVERAQKENARARAERVRFRSGTGPQLVNLEVLPVPHLAAAERCWLVLFESIAARATRTGPASPTGRARPPATAELRENDQLKLELAQLKDYLQSLIEQHDAANEELQAAGEEMQSSNEELQSINEELETSKEELQATNEELTTVNEELSHRHREASRLNDDLNNLVTSAAIPIVIAGLDGWMRRFTPAAEKLLSLTSLDLGRPVAEIAFDFELADLATMLSEVLETASPQQREVQDKAGRWHLLRVRPYRTQDNHIDGVVLALFDVDALKQSELRITAARDYAESILRTTPDPLLVLDYEQRVLTANDAFYKLFQVQSDRAQGRLLYELGNGQWNIPRLRELLEEVLPRAVAFNNFEVTHDFPHIGPRTMLLNGRTLADPIHPRGRILLGILDITDRKRARKRCARPRPNRGAGAAAAGRAQRPRSRDP